MYRHFMLAILCLSFFVILVPASHAQDDDTRHIVQEFSGYLHPADEYYFHAPDLKEGETLYVSLENVSGNLDPLVRIETDDETQTILAEDDDSGHGYNALLAFEVPDDDDYLIVIANHGGETFGEYHLWVGINAPEVLEDDTKHATEEKIITLDLEASEVSLAVQELEDEIDDPTHFYEHELTHINAGHTLYVYLETLEGDLVPHVELLDFSRKVLVAGDANDDHSSVSFAYYVEEGGDHYDLYVGNRDGQTTGKFRLVIGIDSPTVLEGHAHLIGDPIIKASTPIDIGVELLQITDVSQKSENFGVVAILRAEWTDHDQAFNPADCQCSEKVYTGRQFIAFLEENTDFKWPRFHITNQQHERVSQDEVLIIESNGQIRYEEHFSATLQAPEFDFRKFPFDHQDFWIRVETRYHDDVFLLEVHPNDAYNRYGSQLGEEEWVIDETVTEVRDIDGFSRFSFDIRVERHVNFYIYRIMLPLFLIVAVGWAIFFIHDSDARITASSGNLLIFIAFNFTIGDDLPRLGYLTFLDWLLIICFVITAVVFGVNVYTKRLEQQSHENAVRKINRYLIVLYPILFALSIFVLYWQYFLNV